jgi:predicted Zn finger-like uncharacterized protein
MEDTGTQMRIVCPSCQSAYDVPPAVVAARRTLRCARCSADFVAEAEVGAEAEVVAPQPARPPAAPPAPPAAPPRQPAAFVSLAPLIEEPVPEVIIPGMIMPAAQPDMLSRLKQVAMFPPEPEPPNMALAVGAGWVGSFLLLGLMAWAVVWFRVPIMHEWPPSTRLYAALGYSLPLN